MGVLFRASLMTRATDASGGTAAAAGSGSGSAGADLNTLMAVDAGRAANLALSLQELWSLPLQILAAMSLLYMQVGFCLGGAVVLCAVSLGGRGSKNRVWCRLVCVRGGRGRG